jgi:hypothetical protein
VLHLRGLIELRVLILIEIGLVFSVPGTRSQRINALIAFQVRCPREKERGFEATRTKNRE